MSRRCQGQAAGGLLRRRHSRTMPPLVGACELLRVGWVICGIALSCAHRWGGDNAPLPRHNKHKCLVAQELRYKCIRRALGPSCRLPWAGFRKGAYLAYKSGFGGRPATVGGRAGSRRCGSPGRHGLVCRGYTAWAERAWRPGGVAGCVQRCPGRGAAGVAVRSRSRVGQGRRPASVGCNRRQGQRPET